MVKIKDNQFKINNSTYNRMVFNHINKKSEYRNFFHCNALKKFSDRIF